MKPILLVSSDEKLKGSLENTLPPVYAAAGIQRSPDWPMAFWASSRLPEASLIFVDLRDDANPPPAMMFGPLTGEATGTRPPLIAIIQNPSQRAAVFAAGVDDFILAPLQTSELRARLVLIQPRRLQRQDDHQEQMAVVGRLAGILAHEINNSMQAVRGALTLANEEIEEPFALEEYLRVCRSESEQVIRLATRVRQFARFGNGEAEALDLNLILKEVAAFAGKEVSRQRIRLRAELASAPLLVYAFSGHLHIIFLTAALDLGDALAEAGGSEMTLRSERLDDVIRVTLRGEAPGAMPASTGERPFVRDMLFELRAVLRVQLDDRSLALTIDLPAADQAPADAQTDLSPERPE